MGFCTLMHTTLCRSCNVIMRRSIGHNAAVEPLWMSANYYLGRQRGLSLSASVLPHYHSLFMSPSLSPSLFLFPGALNLNFRGFIGIYINPINEYNIHKVLHKAV